MHRTRQSNLARFLQLATLVLLVPATTSQALAGDRFPIREADIARALQTVGVDVSVSQVHLPMMLSAAAASPQLQIVASSAVSDSQIQLELRCGSSSECLPFIATVDVQHAGLTSAEIQSRVSLTSVASHQMASPGQRMPVPANRPLVKAGSHVVLEIQDGHMDIHLQVLAIDTGVMGKQVRVCTPDHKKIFHAIVTGEGTVTGGME